MPIYEYHCEDCKQPFELFVRSVTNPPVAVCPECGSQHVEKGVSAVAAITGAPGMSASTSAAACAPSG